MVLKRKRSFKRTTSKSSAARMLRRRKMASYKAKKRIAYRMKKRIRRSFKGKPTKFAKRSTLARKYISVGREITRDQAYYKISTVFETPNRTMTPTTDEMQAWYYWIHMSTLENPFLRNAAAIHESYVPPHGIDEEIHNRFLSTMVVCQRITATIQRSDNGTTGNDPWEIMLTPLTPSDVARMGVDPAPSVPAYWPAPGAGGDPERYNGQKTFRGTKTRVMFNKAGSDTTGYKSISMTTHMNKMVLSQDFRTHTFWNDAVSAVGLTYEETKSVGQTVPLALRPMWCLGIYRKCPGSASEINPLRYNIRFRYTWWVRAFSPQLTYNIESKGESKEEKKEDHVMVEEPPLENFQRLGVMSPTPRPYPAPVPGGPVPTRPVPLAPAPLLRR